MYPIKGVYSYSLCSDTWKNSIFPAPVDASKSTSRSILLVFELNSFHQKTSVQRTNVLRPLPELLKSKLKKSYPRLFGKWKHSSGKEKSLRVDFVFVSLCNVLSSLLLYGRQEYNTVGNVARKDAL